MSSSGAAISTDVFPEVCQRSITTTVEMIMSPSALNFLRALSVAIVGAGIAYTLIAAANCGDGHLVRGLFGLVCVH